MLQLSGLPIYYQNSIGRLYEDPGGYVIVDYNAGSRLKTDYTAFLQHLENLLKRRGWNKMLANQRLMAPFTEEEGLWIRGQWLTVSHALQREMVAAVLLPDDVFARLGMNSLMHEAREGALVYRIFNDAQAAAVWLRQVA
ncbi:hypothetical protein SAMN06265337_4299 [Hymenobacter gelipurpurascens]|uniref:SpoIIAA-like n=1 Tax=Hymenobacter gelipurpurascens TaxID=89968 RepID=A0A212UHG6_9BACT|nr:hypothetical protein [Hymenobacter gelipurpurascens]SNC77698.1 hypothetical protein SAMN06265337_4299 [Hymenobacter gelipurpurascens]